MEPEGLTALPVEVIHHISRYLSVQDVLSCSLTCHYLRAALNDNCVWRKYLTQDISGLETQEQQVSPRLELGDGFTPLCEMRQHFIRKSHLMNNWRAGNFVKHIHSRSEIEFGDRMLSKSNAIYEDKYIFLDTILDNDTKNGIEIWDISKAPIFCTFFKIEKIFFYTFYIVGSYLIIITQDCRILVYHIKLPDKDFPLLYSFLVTDNNVTFKHIVTYTYNQFTGWRHSFVRNYLMSNNPKEGRLHIWNIDTASKVGSFEPPISTSNISLCSFMGNICMFELTSASSTVLDCLVTFDLDTNQFSSYRFSFEEEENYYNSATISYNYYVTLIKTSEEPNSDGLYNLICTLYDFNTSLKLQQKRFLSTEEYVVLTPVVNGTYIITCHDGLHVINASTLDIVNTLNDGSYYVNFYFNIYQNCIAVAIKNYFEVKLWDVIKKDRLLKDLNLNSRNHLYLDSLCTKLVIIDDMNIAAPITVVHMW